MTHNKGNKYNLTRDESKALRVWGSGMFASWIVIMASVFIGLFSPNQIHGLIIIIGGSSIGFIILIYTTREENKAYKKLYPPEE